MILKILVLLRGLSVFVLNQPFVALVVLRVLVLRSVLMELVSLEFSY